MKRGSERRFAMSRHTSNERYSFALSINLGKHILIESVCTSFQHGLNSCLYRANATSELSPYAAHRSFLPRVNNYEISQSLNIVICARRS